MTLAENIGRAVTDFTSIKNAIIEKGVTVPANTPTSGYAALIKGISGEGSNGGGKAMQSIIEYVGNVNGFAYVGTAESEEIL